MNDALLEHVPCNLCGADRPRVIYLSQRRRSGRLDLGQIRSSGDEPLKDQLVRCRACGLVYVSPRVNSVLMLHGYSGAVDEAFVSQANGRESTFRRSLDLIQKDWGRAPGRLLDVGTANGSFLKVARDAGWDIAGVEPSLWMCRWCEEHYGIKVHPGTIFDARYEAESFDVVTLWDVLEHTPDPMRLLRECTRVLKPTGLLVVNYPDYGSALARLMGRKWVFLLTVHYYYFTRRTIRLTLSRVGCEVVKMKRHVQWLECDYILSRATSYIGTLGHALRKVAAAVGVSRTQIPYWMGQTLVVARKRR